MVDSEYQRDWWIPPPVDWTPEKSEKLYRLQEWGDPYFAINAAGHVTVSPRGDRHPIDLFELVNALKKRNIELPLLIRFSDILADRLERLHRCFEQAIARYSYPGVYRGVFPIKCNQHRHLVESLVRAGQPYHFGLEAGSKPELMIALAILEPRFQPDLEQALLICNGYKDREYVETALLATKLGQKLIIVIEQFEELSLVVSIARQMESEPILGVRVKLSTKGTGRWGNSTGDRAQFGLTLSQILEVVNQLKAVKMSHSLQLLHFHLGSQISSISAIKEAMREAAQVYGELVKLGANMKYLDVGGGLAVDYDGSKTSFAASKNYNMQNYANDIVAEVKEACEERGIPAPVLVSESGRALASHQSVLVFDVLGTDDVPRTAPPSVPHREHLIIRNLWETYRSIDAANYQEAYHDAIQFKEEATSLFSFGYLSLEERARAEQLYWACCGRILEISRHQEYVPEDLADLEKTMMSIYSVNLSVFQSVPDAWAIEQLFPVMPIHRLDEKPCQRGILADVTCDSDGQINQFIDFKAKPVLELHALRSQDKEDNSLLSRSPDREPYYLGMFLVGAYQEVLGSLHNLFGDTNVVHIQINSKGYQIEHLVRGDTVTDVLGYVQYDAEDLLETMRRRAETAFQEKRITLEESQKLLQNYERSLRSYTYLTSSLSNSPERLL